ncbi:MAG: hypothetical protein GY754_29765 [bacterium]|nr:hypothetical protein [bacterium]
MNLKMKIFNKSYIKKFILFLFFSSLISCSGLDDNLVNSLSGSDVTAPSVSISSPGDSNTFGVGTLIIQGSAADDLKLSKVEISVDGGDFYEANNLGLSLSGKKIDWVYYLDLNGVIDGSNVVSAHTISARAVDIWDNAASTEISINVDNTLPAIPVAELSGLPRLIGDGTSIDVSVGGENVVAYRYKLDDANWTAEIDVVGNPNINVSGLGQGEHTLLVVAKSDDGVWQDPFDGATEYTWIVNTQVYFTPPGGGAIDDAYGITVATSSDGLTFAVGAHRDDEKGNEAGAIFVYKWDGSNWATTKLTVFDAGPIDFIGFRMDMSSDGNTIVAGNYYDTVTAKYSGSVYVFRWNGSSWSQTKLISSDGAESDLFGSQVAVSSDGNTFIVAAGGDDDKGDSSGSVYIFKWNGSNWIETKLTASDGSANDGFGGSLAISSDANIIVVGASSKNEKGVYSGKAYIYKWNGSNWDETKIIASDVAENDHFGFAVAISSDGNTVGISASDDNKNLKTGIVYIYKWNDNIWTETKLLASDGAENDQFGSAISISSDGNTIVSGACGDDDKGDSAGAAYVFKWNGSSWDETKITPQYATTSKDYFGLAVDISADASMVIVGAYGGLGNNKTGSAYLYYP